MDGAETLMYSTKGKSALLIFHTYFVKSGGYFETVAYRISEDPKHAFIPKYRLRENSD